jgi:hypothetical protein
MSKLDLQHQSWGTSSVNLDKQRGHRQNLPHGLDHSTAVPSLLQLSLLSTVAMSSTPTPDSLTTLLLTWFPLPGRRLLLLYTFHIGCPSFHLSGSVAIKYAHAAIIDSPTLHTCSTFTNIQNHSEQDLIIHAKWSPTSFLLSPKPASPGGLVEIRMCSLLPDVPDKSSEEDTIRKLV